jgi:hypothetical protein
MRKSVKMVRHPFKVRDLRDQCKVMQTIKRLTGVDVNYQLNLARRMRKSTSGEIPMEDTYGSQTTFYVPDKLQVKSLFRKTHKDLRENMAKFKPALRDTLISGPG